MGCANHTLQTIALDHPASLPDKICWRYSRPTWTRSCAACCRRLCFGRGVDEM